MALDGPFEVGLRHHVCSPARPRLDLAWWHGAFPVWCVCRVLSGVGSSRVISRIICVLMGSRPEPALFAHTQPVFRARAHMPVCGTWVSLCFQSELKILVSLPGSVPDLLL